LFYVKDPNTIVKVSKVTGVTGTGGANDQIDVTDLDSTEKEFIAGLPNPGAVSAALNFNSGEVVHRDLYALWQSGVKVKWIIGLADGTADPTITTGTITWPTTRTYFEFEGYISDFPVDSATNSKVETSMTVQRSGPKTPHWKALV
ncbi:MAG: phage tail tube protein, partial [Solimonas sp.]